MSGLNPLPIFPSLRRAALWNVTQSLQQLRHLRGRLGADRAGVPAPVANPVRDAGAFE